MIQHFINRLFYSFLSIPVYIRMYSDKVVITRLDTGRTISRTAKEKFSSSRLVIANFGFAEDAVLATLKELNGTPLLSPALRVVIQQMEKLEGGLSQIEKRALLDLAEHMGGAMVTVLEHGTELTTAQALEVLKNSKGYRET